MATPSPTVVHLDEVGSTQDEARSRFDGPPVLVTATRQTAGRGRSGAEWQTADRAVAASLAFAPGWDAAALPRLTLVSGLAAVDAVGDGVDLSLKWPNDVVTPRGKAAGLLVETADDVVVAGMGMNLFWVDPPAGAAALFGDDPGVEAARALAVRWATGLLVRSAAGPDAWGRDEYSSRCATLGREIAWEPDGRGRAVGVAPDGGLVVETATGTMTLRSGAVRHVRVSGE
jgi:BirA family biotin operon repressor/biotin-[acetyl-CoA-carboxylase] ligase